MQNSVVGMFFHVNWLHDRWYEAGFDEASGNAQKNNFGRGGRGGDPILAEGNDFSGTDNANMATPADGVSPRMQMFVFTGTTPTRTSNHEALITFHEMGHYITNRLVGNGNGLTNQQGGAMGEGWGDFFAICMTSQKQGQLRQGRVRGRRLDRSHARVHRQLLLLDPAVPVLGGHDEEPAHVQAHQQRCRAARGDADQRQLRRQQRRAQRRRSLVRDALGGVRATS